MVSAFPSGCRQTASVCKQPPQKRRNTRAWTVEFRSNTFPQWIERSVQPNLSLHPDSQVELQWQYRANLCFHLPSCILRTMHAASQNPIRRYPSCQPPECLIRACDSKPCRAYRQLPLAWHPESPVSETAGSEVYLQPLV